MTGNKNHITEIQYTEWNAFHWWISETMSWSIMYTKTQESSGITLEYLQSYAHKN